MEREIVSVNISVEKGTRKTPVGEAFVRVGHGLDGDAHAGDWHRQVSLLSQASIDAMNAHGVELHPGDFAENLTTRGIDLWRLPVGTRLAIGAEVVLEVTQIGKECHQGCEIRRQVGDCVMPRQGIFARVLREGKVRVADAIEVIPPEGV